MGFPKIEIDEIESAMFMLHDFWHGNLILTLLSCENPSNIWKLNYEPQMHNAKNLTHGEMELVLLRNEWISLFGHGTFQRCFHAFYSIRSNTLAMR